MIIKAKLIVPAGRLTPQRRGAHDLPLQSGLGLCAPPRAAPTGQDEFAAAARAVADRSTTTDDWAWEVVAGTSLAHVRHQSPLPMYEKYH